MLVVSAGAGGGGGGAPGPTGPAGADGTATIVTGPPLANHDEHLQVWNGNRYVLGVATLTAPCSKTLDATGVTEGEIVTIDRLDTSANAMTVIDGPGILPLYVFPGGQKRTANFYYNGANYVLAGQFAIN